MRKSNFNISDIQILLSHQIPNYKTTNAFYWVILDVKKSVNEIWPVCHITKDKILSKNSTKTVT